jgi:uncharacterized protein
MTRRVYDAITDSARRILLTGQSVIVDAVFARRSDRYAIERAAESAGVPFVGVWLDAPERVLAARLRGRHADASDADPEVVHSQVARGTSELTWHRLEASGEADQVMKAAVGAVEEALDIATRETPHRC